MEHIGKYIICVCSAGIICAVVNSLAGKGNLSNGMVKLLSGVFVAVVVVSPWKRFSFTKLTNIPLELSQNASIYVEQGQEDYKKQMASIITEKIEAYILEKALQMNAQVEVRVELSDSNTPVPVSASIWGNVTQKVKEELSTCMEIDLGISKEMQIWNESKFPT